MSFEGDGELFCWNATAIVFNRYQPNPTAEQSKRNLPCARIQRIVKQLTHHGGGSLDHFTRCNLADEHIRQFSNGGWGLGFGHRQIVGAGPPYFPMKGEVFQERDNLRMEYLMQLIDFILHVDRYLEMFVANYGPWVYALLFLIIFVETGLVVMPFLPGDSLLFVVGAMCGVGLMDYGLSVALLVTAAIAGNQTNYTIGHYFGPKVFAWENSRFFNRQAFDQAHAFYERYGGITIVAARFMPFLRTFAPFVAGVAQMTRSKFTFFDVTGGLLWVGGIVSAGYFFGNIEWVKLNLQKIIWAMILIPGALALYGAWKGSRAPKA